MSYNDSPSPLARAATAGVVLVIIISLIGGVMAYKQVPEGHEGVEKNWGAVTGNTLESGAHFKAPIMTSVQSVETRPRTYTMSQTQGEGQQSHADAISVKTVNGSSVAVDITVRYRVNSEDADTFVSEWNDEEQMESRLIRPTIRSVLRDEASSLQTTGDGSIYTQEGRQALESTAQEALNQEFENQPVELEAVQIRNIDLPDQIDQTLDEKEQAKQQVQVENEQVKQEEARAEQKIVQAEADAEAIEIQGESLQDNPIVLQERKIQAYDDGTVFVTQGDEQILIDGSQAGNSSSGVPAGPGGN